jgi:hypothetical protein
MGCMMSFPFLTLANTFDIWYAYIANVVCALVSGILLFFTITTDREMNMEISQSIILPSTNAVQTSVESFSTTVLSEMALSEVVGNSQILEKVASCIPNALDFPLLSPLVEVHSERENSPDSMFELDPPGTIHSLSVSQDRSLLNLMPIVESERFVASPSPNGTQPLPRAPIFKISRTASNENPSITIDNEIEHDPHIRGRIDVETRTIQLLESPLDSPLMTPSEAQSPVADEQPNCNSNSMQATDLPAIPEEPANPILSDERITLPTITEESTPPTLSEQESILPNIEASNAIEGDAPDSQMDLPSNDA